ncbi:hypothetical protein GW793_00515 [bacterium]|nr:hypothetical protein [bacterium]
MEINGITYNIVRRLEDRGVQKSILDYRKQVHLVALDSGKKAVLVEIKDAKYRPIYRKNVQGLIICSEQNINAPHLLADDDVGMQFLMSYVGENILNEDYSTNDLLKLGMSELEKLNRVNQTSVEFRLPRYLADGLKVYLDNGIKTIIPNYEQAVGFLNNQNDTYKYGFGLEDPSPSNFCYDGQKVSLIDFDNFSTTVNFEYSIGFMIADLLVRRNQHFGSINTLRNATTSILGFEGFGLQFYTGILSLLSTFILDIRVDEERASGSIQQWKNEINLVAYELANTFP